MYTCVCVIHVFIVYVCVFLCVFMHVIMCACVHMCVFLCVCDVCVFELNLDILICKIITVTKHCNEIILKMYRWDLK